jgi:hypothetical protein
LKLSTLAQQIRQDWSRLAPLLAVPESVTLLESLYASMPRNIADGPNWFATDKGVLSQFLDSTERFNRNWRTYIEGLDLDIVNKSRRDFNQYYAVEKACAFGNDRVVDGFEPLEMIDREYLFEKFPILKVPELA